MEPEKKAKTALIGGPLGPLRSLRMVRIVAQAIIVGGQLVVLWALIQEFKLQS